MQPPRPVWLDCDPGHDDAMAIILAGYNPSINLLGISTTHGNQTQQKITRNAALVLKASGLDHLKVIPGQTKPLTRASLTCPDIHGDTGLDGNFVLPPYDESLVLHGKKAVLHIAEIIQSYGDNDKGNLVTLIATGPLTNYALLLTLYPEIHHKIKEIIFMGGAIGNGNWTPCAEFNILVDPEAASIVIQSGIPVTMVPLEVTHQAIVTDEVIQTLETRLRKTAFCNLNGPPLHDPCAVAVLISPQIFTIRQMNVNVVTEQGHCLGRTVCDIYNKIDAPKINVAIDIKSQTFMDIMIDALTKANTYSPMNQ